MTRASFVALLPIVSGVAFLPQRGAGIMTKRSRLSYADTLAKLKDTIASAGNTVFASIDQAAAAQTVGMTLRPTTLLMFGNPKAGTPLMDAFPLFALELPLKLIVWDENGTVNVAYTPLKEVATQYGVTGMDERIAAIDHAVDTLTNTVV